MTRADGADAYVRHLETLVFPEIAALAGHEGARILRRPVDAGVEFLVITFWSSMDAIRAFAGDDLERAVVHEDAAALMVEFDEHVAHWTV